MRLGTYYRAAVLESLGLAKCEGRVLDVGGYDGFLLSRIDAPHKVSVDIETLRLNGGIDYCLGDGLCLPFSDGAFDSVYALDVLEHVDDEEQFARELLRVLKPGGRLLLSTPQSDVRIFPGVLQPWVNRKWQHFRTAGYSRQFVEGLFLTLSPRDVQVSSLSSPWFLKLYMPLSALWRLAPALSRAVLDRVAWLDSSRRGSGGYLLAWVTK